MTQTIPLSEITGNQRLYLASVLYAHAVSGDIDINGAFGLAGSEEIMREIVLARRPESLRAKEWNVLAVQITPIPDDWLVTAYRHLLVRLGREAGTGGQEE